MEIKAFQTESAFEMLRAEWNTLLSQSTHNHLFLTWEWQSTWWKVYQAGTLWILAIYDEDRLVGIAPWFIEERTGKRIVRTVGCVDVTDYLGIILHKQCVGDALHLLANYVVENQDGYDAIDLCNIPENSALLTDFSTFLKSQGMFVEIEQQEVCPVISLPDSWDAYLEMLDKKNRHELRRKIRRADNTEETITWYIVNESHSLEDEIDHFLKLMASASEEKAKFLETPEHAVFFRLVIKTMWEAGWLQMAFLLVDGVYATAYLNFDYDNEILVYNSGLNLGVSANLSAGILLLANLIQFAIENGRRKFDFLRGNEHYKYRMGAKDTKVFMLHASFNPLAVDADVNNKISTEVG